MSKIEIKLDTIKTALTLVIEKSNDYGMVKWKWDKVKNEVASALNAVEYIRASAHNSDYMKKPSALEYNRICTKEGIDPIMADLIYNLFFA